MHLHPVDSPVAALVLGHGAGGGITSPDLVGATKAAGSAGLSVALVEQPYRVAGRRSPAPASQLDAAWAAVVSRLHEGLFSGLPVLTGGRSLGARVACRTAATTDSVAVICQRPEMDYFLPSEAISATLSVNSSCRSSHSNTTT